jgi:hypothetical protein
MISNGPKLILSANLGGASKYRYIFLLISISALIVFFCSLLVHKMIGVELIHTFQIIYITHLGNNNYT